jgi:hypothetical protein
MLFFASLAMASYGARAQDNAATHENGVVSFQLSGYLETYYVYDFNRPESNTRPDFIYSYNRHNEVNLNLGFIRASVMRDRLRANFGVMTGTYANANLAAEPGVLKNIFEANTGLKLSSTHELWFDAGIFPSHIGFESAIGKDCWNLTRSLLADNSPYYEAGAKLSYSTKNERWFFSTLLLNGWQRIQRVEGNSLPSWGTQITFKPGERITLNSSSFMGTDTPDSIRLMRYFHNLYGIFQFSRTVGLILGFDIGSQDKLKGSGGKNVWYSPIAIVRWVTSEKISVAVRAEHYNDRAGVIITSDMPRGFRTSGLSLNMDYTVSAQALWRIEVRHLNSADNIFPGAQGFSRDNAFISTALAVSF